MLHRFLHAGWWSWWYLWAFLKFAVPTAISGAALAFVLHDRRPHLKLVAKKGEWCVLRRLTNGEVSFEGVVEVYNRSSRANAIRNYEFFRALDGEWFPMEAEQYLVGEKIGDEKPHTIREFNKTPISLGPYSAQEISVQALLRTKAPYEMDVVILVEDLFEKRYTLKVKAAME